MKSEVVDSLRYTMLFQIEWTSADHAPHFAETTADQPTIRWLPNPQNEVVVVMRNVYIAITELQFSA